MPDYCVICGDIIPEGTMVCINCKHDILEDKQKEE